MFQRRRLVPASALVTATLLTLGCRESFDPLSPPDAPAFVVGAASLETSGRGGIGSSVALPGMNRQEFDFLVTSPPAGRLFIRDYSVVRTSAELLASLRVDPADPATGISQVEQTSATCVVFGGIGRVDTGDLFAFSVTACDNGSPGARVDFFSITVPDINYTKQASLTDGEITISGQTKGDIAVQTVTTGTDLDVDGYTVMLDNAVSQATGANATVRFNAVPEGTHLVQISGLASNCVVSGSDSRTVTVTGGAVTNTSFEVTCTAVTPERIDVTGLGVIGTDPPLPGMNRFELDFAVNSDFTGRVLLTDYSVTRSDGSPGSMTVDPADPETFISSFSRTSARCVAFGGVGRLNDRALLYAFFIDVCDNASPGAGSDTFQVNLPDRPYSKSGTLSGGDIVISSSTTS